MNSLKWFLVSLLVTVGVVGNYHFSNQSLLVRMIALLAIAGVSIFLALKTDTGQRLARFSADAKAELRKVVWPTRKETVQTTTIVIAMVAIAGLVLWGIDALLLRLIAWITGYGAV